MRTADFAIVRQMLADFFAKPNNGVQFKKFRSLAMGQQKIF